MLRMIAVQSFEQMLPALFSFTAEGGCRHVNAVGENSEELLSTRRGPMLSFNLVSILPIQHLTFDNVYKVLKI